ncbi:MAG TPA: DUF484 family protein [Burkholderiales bacterium]|nr:DUF484 family protein [Burkholderiales bacterium]
MRAEEVARYLKEHPEFFEEYAELLASLQIPHPHGGRAIPISERQMLALREKGRVLEGKLRELVQFGEQNDSIGERVHRITLALLAARDLPGLLGAVHSNLRGDFAVPAVALRLWGDAQALDRIEFREISQESRVFAESLTDPYFSAQPVCDTGDWLESGAAALRSLVYIPLRAQRVRGLLILGSDDPQRFSADKGTLYLTRLGEALSTALERYAQS